MCNLEVKRAYRAPLTIGAGGRVKMSLKLYSLVNKSMTYSMWLLQRSLEGQVAQTLTTQKLAL